MCVYVCVNVYVREETRMYTHTHIYIYIPEIEREGALVTAEVIHREDQLLLLLCVCVCVHVFACKYM